MLQWQCCTTVVVAEREVSDYDLTAVVCCNDSVAQLLWLQRERSVIMTSLLWCVAMTVLHNCCGCRERSQWLWPHCCGVLQWQCCITVVVAERAVSDYDLTAVVCCNDSVAQLLWLQREKSVIMTSLLWCVAMTVLHNCCGCRESGQWLWPHCCGVLQWQCCTTVVVAERVVSDYDLIAVVCCNDGSVQLLWLQRERTWMRWLTTVTSQLCPAGIPHHSEYTTVPLVSQSVSDFILHYIYFFTQTHTSLLIELLMVASSLYTLSTEPTDRANKTPHTHTHTHTHALSLTPPTPTPPHTHTHALSLTPPPPHTHTHSLSPPPPHTHTHTCTLPPPPHTHTHLHSHSLKNGSFVTSVCTYVCH